MTEPPNTHLIDAAADMLDALKEIARYPVARGYPDGACIEQEDMKQVLAAIAKAEGRAP